MLARFVGSMRLSISTFFGSRVGDREIQGRDSLDRFGRADDLSLVDYCKAAAELVANQLLGKLLVVK
jgi:hypothetical protein